MPFTMPLPCVAARLPPRHRYSAARLTLCHRSPRGSALAHDPTVPSIGVLPRTSPSFHRRPTLSHSASNSIVRTAASSMPTPLFAAAPRSRPRRLPRSMACAHRTAYHDLHAGDGEYAAVAHCATRRESPAPSSAHSRRPAHPRPCSAIQRRPPRSRSRPPCLPKRHADARCSGRL
ncbi:hypothetical protein B0H13DRAFT_2146249, partial [Mycena leptocephala]